VFTGKTHFVLTLKDAYGYWLLGLFFVGVYNTDSREMGCCV
jgi:hypothetical protein